MWIKLVNGRVIEGTEVPRDGDCVEILDRHGVYEVVPRVKVADSGEGVFPGATIELGDEMFDANAKVQL